MDLTKDDLDLTTDLTNNNKQHHCKSRTHFSNHQHPTSTLRYTKEKNGEGRAKHSQTVHLGLLCYVLRKSEPYWLKSSCLSNY